MRSLRDRSLRRALQVIASVLRILGEAPMTTGQKGRRRMPVGLPGFVVNLLCWGIIVVLAPPLDHDPFPQMKIAEAASQGMRFDSAHCWDCPAFSLFGKEFGSYWDPMPVKVFLVANWPALRLARGPEGALGVAPLNPLVLLLVSSAQWFLLGASWRAWRKSGRAKQPSSMVEA